MRHAIRRLISERAFSLVALTCLALGIAANTTMFSVYDAMFLRPLPFPHPNQLVTIGGRHPDTGARMPLTLDDSHLLASAFSSFTLMAAYQGRTLTLTDGDEPERISALRATASLFPTLGVQPQAGRAFDSTDDLPSAAAVALISDGLWHRRYRADPAVIGRVVRLDGIPHTVVGVMPAHFRYPSASDLWTPMAPALNPSGAAPRVVSVVARLADGVTIDRVNAEMASSPLPPSSASRGPHIGFARPLRQTGVGSEERIVASAMLGATSVLLLIACANVASLLLARGAARRREIAVRAALGASRGRIIRQLLIESVALALVACALALPLAYVGIGLVRDAVPPSDGFPYYMRWSLDLRTLLYATAVTMLTGVTFGLAPAFSATGQSLLEPLREGSAASGSSRSQRRGHDALIVVQIALALILLTGASLFVRTFAGLSQVQLGYDLSKLMTMRVYLAGAKYDSPAARARAVDAISAKLDALPGAAAATVSDLVPLDDQGGADSPAEVEGRTFEAGREPVVQYAGVAGHWLETFDLKLSAGRTFSDSELLGDVPVALINRTLAEEFWPGQHSVGRRFRLEDVDGSPWFSVIGVVPDIRTVKLDETRVTPPTAYVPHRFILTRSYGIIIRTRGMPESVTREVRQAVSGVDDSLALFDVWSMEEVRWLSFWMYGLWGTMFGVFGAIALVLAAVGVYSVTFYTVAQRTREIGVRVALGARRSQVARPMLRHAGILAGAGIVIGLAGALALTPIVGSLLIGVSPNDPTSFAIVSITLAAVAVAATWIPAWRASAVNPTVALRKE